jgi:hypothetical protein
MSLAMCRRCTVPGPEDAEAVWRTMAYIDCGNAGEDATAALHA